MMDMLKSRLIVIGIIVGAVVLALVGLIIWINVSVQNQRKALSLNKAQSPTPTVSVTPPVERSAYVSAKGVVLHVTTPRKGAAVASPLTVSGQVPGSWSHEAQFPVKLVDRTGKVLVQAPAKLSGNWQTASDVPFNVTLEFSAPAGQTGTLVLSKDNPSGQVEQDDSVRIPIQFQ